MTNRETMLEELALKAFIAKLEAEDNFVFVKFGDGEFLCMLDMKGENCDRHPYSKELGDKLKAALKYLSGLGNCYIADWRWDMEAERDSLFSDLAVMAKFVDFSVILHQDAVLKHKPDMAADLRKFYMTLRESKRKKVFVGPARLEGVVRLLKCDQHVVVPVVNAFAEYDRINTELAGALAEGCIGLFSAGMPSKALIHEAVVRVPKATYIDTGSAFDPVFVGRTRTPQACMVRAREFYKGLL